MEKSCDFDFPRRIFYVVNGQFLANIERRLNELSRKRPWLAKQSGIPVSTINTWFHRPDMRPNLSDAFAVAQALGVTLDYLMTGKHPQPDYADPIVAEIIDYAETLSHDELVEARTAMKMMRYMKLRQEERRERESAGASA